MLISHDLTSWNACHGGSCNVVALSVTYWLGRDIMGAMSQTQKAKICIINTGMHVWVFSFQRRQPKCAGYQPKGQAKFNELHGP